MGHTFFNYKSRLSKQKNTQFFLADLFGHFNSVKMEIQNRKSQSRVVCTGMGCSAAHDDENQI